jgi:hypothetical protein
MKDIERFVEAHFLGIELSESTKAVKLVFREPNGRRFFLAGFHLHRLLVSEFRETNIVDHLNLWDSTADADTYRDALCGLVSGQDDPQNADWKQLFDAETKSIRDGTKVFASIEAVYGAQILMLAESIVVSE